MLEVIVMEIDKNYSYFNFMPLLGVFLFFVLFL